MVLAKVTFFFWTAAKCKILIVDNLIKHKKSLLRCMCKVHREIVNHLLLHYVIARAMWSLVFSPF